jgi:hypothetical protein
MSDADQGVAAAMAADADPWPDAATINTEAAPDRCVEHASTLVRGLTTGNGRDVTPATAA